MITRAVYTYWTDNGSNFLCGFNDEDAFKSVFIKSIEKSNEFFEEVVCYTDQEGSDKLDELNILVDKIIIDYSEYDFNKKFWNFPKIITYNLQEKPFVHIDIDLILNEDPMLKDEIVSEKYRNSLILAYDYKFLGRDTYKYYKGKLACSGLFGGKNIDAFKELFTSISEIVKVENSKFLHVTFNKLVAIEEIALTSIINRDNLKVQYLNTDYVHYQGSQKRNL